MLTGVERGPSAILGHCNVCHSAICSSNCRVRGIFYISSTEAQQLQLSWHVVGVLEEVWQLKGCQRLTSCWAPPTGAHLYKQTHKRTRCHNHVFGFCLHVQLNNDDDVPKHQRGDFAPKSASLSTTAHHHSLDLFDLEESAAVKTSNICIHKVCPPNSTGHLQALLNIFIHEYTGLDDTSKIYITIHFLILVNTI